MSDDEQATIARTVSDEGNAAMRVGAGYAAIFGFASALMIVTLTATRVLSGLTLPAIFAVIAGSYATLVHVLARKKRLHGALLYVALLGFVSIPTSLFVASHLLLPAGAATFISGPYVYLYLCIIVTTGLFFDLRLARLAGVVAAIEYVICVVLASPRITQITAPDPLMQQDLNSPPVYMIRATMMLLCGFLVGALATIARRLLHRVLREQRESAGLSRLFGQFVSPEVKERILAEQSGVRGERKRVVVLFSDIRGFTTYSEQADPDQLVEHLNAYFDGMVKSIQREGGVIDKFIGDAIMAVFGGVLTLEQPAEKALDAAKSMRRALVVLNESSAGRWPSLDTGIGMHYGEVVQGTIGSVDRKDFTVIGDVVNTASRVEGASKTLGYAIVVTRAFVDALPESRRAECERIGPVKLKGKTDEVEVFGVRA